MKIKHTFKTRGEAALYLVKRGYTRNGSSLGDWLFVNELVNGSQWRIIIRLVNGKWIIQHIDPLAVKATKDLKPGQSMSPRN